MTVKTLHIIGCGKVGRTLARLWHEAGLFSINGIVNRTENSAAKAVSFIGAGRAIATISALPPADLVMIASGDDQIESLCSELAKTHSLDKTTVFHCSGALSSFILKSAKQSGALTASLHPVKSFADTADSVKTFAGTYCGMEGDKEALTILEQALHKCGAKTFAIRPQQKTLYHAASVLICNDLIALMEMGFQCYEQAGIPREFAVEITKPMVAETIHNIQTKGTACALTGPVARGDMQTFESHLQALKDWDSTYAGIYEQLGKVAMDLAQQQKRMAA